ncbi:MAG: tetratricopeptide repeat protein [Salinivenus sp.]
MTAPDLQDALNALQRRDLDTAIATLEDTVDTMPAHPTAHVLLARAYETRDRWSDALTHWAQAQRLVPNSPVAREGKTRVLRKMETNDPPQDVPRLLDVVSASDLGLDPSRTPSEEQDAPSDASEAPDDLAKLRQHAETEARRGGARSGLADAPDLPASDDTPEDRVADLEAEAPDDDLDRLIDELESARIDPDPDAADAPAPDLDDEEADDLVSETLARIYKQQGQYGEAARVYDKLAEQQPDRSEEFRQEAAEMRSRAEDEDGPNADA